MVGFMTKIANRTFQVDLSRVLGWFGLPVGLLAGKNMTEPKSPDMRSGRAVWVELGIKVLWLSRGLR